MGSRLVSKMQALIEVVDTGVGIPPNFISRIFEPLLHDKGPRPGNWSRSAAVQGIVIQNHGSIALESVVGQGTALGYSFRYKRWRRRFP